MDYRHHHLVSHHRSMVVEAASQRLGGCRHDEREEGHDVRNPYMTFPVLGVKVHHRAGVGEVS